MTRNNISRQQNAVCQPVGGAVIGTATMLAPGTCGELVQGMTGGVNFLVTCPVNQFSRVTVTLRADGVPDNADPAVPDNAGPDHSVRGVDHRPKTRRAVALALPRIALMAGISADLAAAVSVSSPLPAGKGMGSSSADITAAVAAAAAAAGIALPPSEIAEIALAVEPTDGVMFPGIALFDHRRGRIAQSLGPPPPMEAIIIDRGGQLDTLEFNAVDRTAQWQAVAAQTDAALELVRAGIRRNDAALIGRGATISARAGHPPGAGAWLERAIALAEEISAAGVNAAHSGTVIGILLDARRRHSKPAYRRARAAFPDAADIHHCRIIGGGARAP